MGYAVKLQRGGIDKNIIVLFDIEQAWNVYNWTNSQIIEHVSGNLRSWGSGNETSDTTWRFKTSGYLRCIVNKHSSYNPLTNYNAIQINGGTSVLANCNVWNGNTYDTGNPQGTQTPVSIPVKTGDLLRYYVASWYNNCIIMLSKSPIVY